MIFKTKRSRFLKDWDLISYLKRFMERLLAGTCTAVYWFDLSITTGSSEGEEGGGYLHSPAQILTKSHCQNSACSCLLPFLIPWILIFYRFFWPMNHCPIACNVLQQKRDNSSSHITTLGVSHNDSTFAFNIMAATLSSPLQQACAVDIFGCIPRFFET